MNGGLQSFVARGVAAQRAAGAATTIAARLRLGYAVPSGELVEIPVAHMVVTGLTQHAGKTTALEALLSRAPGPSVTFRTKRGELALQGRRVLPYFRERADWQYVEALLEAALRERLRFERSWIMRATKGAETLRQVWENVRRLLRGARGLHESVYTALDHYLALVVPQVEATRFARTLKLGPGLNVMELAALSPEMQQLVVRSTVDAVMDDWTGVIVVLPEAWAFLPQTRGGPVKAAAERLFHEGAVLGNFGWLDSQDLAGVDKRFLKHVGVWLLGCQPESNEAEHTLRQIPLPRAVKAAIAAIQSLPRGHFVACAQGVPVRTVYVQPAWLDDHEARLVAMGTLDVERVAARQREHAARQEEEPEVCDQHAALEAEIVQVREELGGVRKEVTRLTRSLEAAESELRTQRALGNQARETAERLRAQGEAAGRFVAALREFLGAADAAELPGAAPAAALDEAALVRRVLAQLPAGGAGPILQVTPPEKLRHDFQEAEVTRLLAAIATLKPLPRRILLFVEATDGDFVGQKVLAERLGHSTQGGSWIDFGKAVNELATLGLVEVRERHGVRRRLRGKIGQDLAFYRALEADIDATHAQVLARLAEAGPEA